MKRSFHPSFIYEYLKLEHEEIFPDLRMIGHISNKRILRVQSYIKLREFGTTWIKVPFSDLVAWSFFLGTIESKWKWAIWILKYLFPRAGYTSEPYFIYESLLFKLTCCFGFLFINTAQPPLSWGRCRWFLKSHMLYYFCFQSTYCMYSRLPIAPQY